MKTFIVTKQVEAKNIKDALKKKKNEPVITITEVLNEEEIKIGFKS